ncbi:hypothetical protein Rsub_06566 [Raphidocelis subcapitata]|uniref:Uncharacterized protein n=1 Tax=Raphidocelis subcapitata TaxID=307507 RepID=A0A2V0P6E1_9CHLO|nr:hypothetical protein Rsub_06566 [Raphidocelis subcapitata]|eukprot:GBF93433.1 hypothetical protein Rsub_06566 [Raphidocelis subcapitata]
MRSPLASYKAALKARAAYCRGKDTDAAALAALAACAEALRGAHPRLARLTAGWDLGGDAPAERQQQGGPQPGGGQMQQQQQLQQQPMEEEAEEEAAARAPAVAHSFDLALDDPAFLLASALLAAALLREARGEVPAAAAAAAAALAVFPDFVAPRLVAARAELAEAGDGAAMARAERHLAAAVAASEALARLEDGLVVESNKACAREAEAGNEARRALAMLLAQAGRDGEAAAHLRELGFAWRLGRGVLCYPLPSSAAAEATAANGGGGAKGGVRLPLSVLDGGLPAPLLSALQAAFAPEAPFWGEHGYGPRQGYFSYCFPLDNAPRSLLSQLALHLQRLAAPHFPEVAEARYAEWWAHCRRHCSGHQLHFDSDDEGTGGVRNPIISSVAYLESKAAGQTLTGAAAGAGSGCHPSSAGGGVDGSTQCTSSSGGSGSGPSGAAGPAFVGGPTLVTDQRLGGPLAQRGWLAYPATGRVTFFEGSVLHGVIPGRGPSPDPTARRCTLMVAFWRDLLCRTPPEGQLGAAMAMPPVPQQPRPGSGAIGGDGAGGAGPADGASWLSALAPLPDGWDGGGGAAAASAAKPVAPVAVPAVWEPVDEAGSRAAPSYDACFQGF